MSNSYRIWGQLIGSDPRKHRAGVGIYKPNKGQKNHTNQGHCVSAMIALAPRNEPTKTHLDLIYFHFCPHCCVGGQNGIIVVLKRGLFMTKILRKCPNNLYIGCIWKFIGMFYKRTFHLDPEEGIWPFYHPAQPWTRWNPYFDSESNLPSTIAHIAQNWTLRNERWFWLSQRGTSLYTSFQLATKSNALPWSAFHAKQWATHTTFMKQCCITAIR